MKELIKGIVAESEHRDAYEAMRKGKIKSARAFYTMIASAHLKEDPHYYSKLEAIESPVIALHPKIKGIRKRRSKIYTLVEV